MAYNKDIAGEGDGQRLLAQDTAEHGVVYIRSKRSRWQLFRSWFGSFALGAIFAWTVVAITYQWQLSTQKSSFKFAETDALPSIPYDTITFESDPIYSERPNDDTDDAWNSLLPNGRGYVFVPESEQRGLLPGEATEYGPIYSVAMFHQLHCLARLRKSHWILLDGVATGDTGVARGFAGREAAQHIQHCFDYLRQSVMCAGDMTLEWPKQEGTAAKAKVDGWGVPHMQVEVCD
ncbi:hypothetical protein AMS68_005066 [Peltaster fructicola]|uniref:DUF3328 domain-containing protein n=1 Tax=Peltaster fructicola TaxID=286661 RepID=A0A6H0XY52_9PEZI|nr:hypothetical protein AMS68_005066 [Peltaster fructicola]